MSTPDWNAQAAAEVQSCDHCDLDEALCQNCCAAALATAYQQGLEDGLKDMAAISKKFYEELGINPAGTEKA